MELIRIDFWYMGGDWKKVLQMLRLRVRRSNTAEIHNGRNDINTLTHAINNAKESIFAAKEDGTLIFANRQFLHNHGIPESEEIGKLKIYEIAGDMNTQ